MQKFVLLKHENTLDIQDPLQAKTKMRVALQWVILNQQIEEGMQLRLLSPFAAPKISKWKVRIVLDLGVELGGLTE